MDEQRRFDIFWHDRPARFIGQGVMGWWVELENGDRELVPSDGTGKHYSTCIGVAPVLPGWEWTCQRCGWKETRESA